MATAPRRNQRSPLLGRPVRPGEEQSRLRRPSNGLGVYRDLHIGGVSVLAGCSHLVAAAPDRAHWQLAERDAVVAAATISCDQPSRCHRHPPCAASTCTSWASTTGPLAGKPPSGATNDHQFVLELGVGVPGLTPSPVGVPRAQALDNSPWSARQRTGSPARRSCVPGHSQAVD
jgi:hypothetical protein